MNRLTCVYGRTLIITTCVFLSLLGTGWCYQIWTILKDDDGTCESIWGSGGPDQSLCKIFTIDAAPACIEAAMIRYEMGANPYHAQTQSHYAKPVAGVEWTVDLVIQVNGIVVAKGSPAELATKGWHRVTIDPAVLDGGDNLITFTLKGKGGGCFYLGIDTNTQCQRSGWSWDNGRHCMFDTLRPGCDPDPKWQGEYMVRLMIALREKQGL